jgi:hypothetical protein
MEQKLTGLSGHPKSIEVFAFFAKEFLDGTELNK